MRNYNKDLIELSGAKETLKAVEHICRPNKKNKRKNKKSRY